MTRIRTQQIDQSGATDAQVLTWDDAAGMWAPADTYTSGVLLVPLTTTNASGDPVLVWDGEDQLIFTEVPA